MKKGKKHHSHESEKLKLRLQSWAIKIGVQPRRVQVQQMTTKWASCSTGGRICLSKDLLKEDADFQEMVIVHELLHLRIPNHGKLFKSLMSAYLPNWDKVSEKRIKRLCGRSDQT
ncbi:MAG: M48 metallopeptidase family protein [Nitrospiria bacterium]